MSGWRTQSVVLSLLAMTGCSSLDYHARLPAGPPKPLGYPIPVYTMDMRVPRPCDIIGTARIHAGKMTVFVGGPETQMAEIMQKAHENGADVVKVTDIEKPDYANPHYRITANLMRYADVWETLDITRNGFVNYLEAHRQQLDPIEGIWYCNDHIPHFIGIVRNTSMPGRDFIGFILETRNPAWPTGTKKMDIRRGLEPGSYVMAYYVDDFAEHDVSFILGKKQSFMFNLPQDEQDHYVAYVKFQ